MTAVTLVSMNSLFTCALSITAADRSLRTCRVAVAGHTIVSCPLVVESFLTAFAMPPLGVSLAV